MESQELERRYPMMFDKEIYCKQNLNTKDRNELNFWEDLIHHIIDQAINYIEYDYGTEGKLGEIVIDFVRKRIKQDLYTQAGVTLNNIMISLIDHYPEDEELPRHSDGKNYYYVDEEEE